MAATLLALGACAPGDPPAPPPATTPRTPNLAPAEPLPGSTPPGTRLRFGEQAVVTIGRADAPVRIGVIITGVDRASEADMTSLRATFPRSVHRWAFLIRAEVVRIDDGGTFSGFSGPTIQGDLRNGGSAGALNVLGADLVLPTCTHRRSPPRGWDAPGDRYDTCRVVFAHPSRVRVPVTGGDLYWE